MTASDVEGLILVLGEDVVDALAARSRRLRLDGRGRIARALGQVGEVIAGGGDGRFFVLRQQIAAAGDLAVHAGAAHLFERHLLADHHLRHSGRAEVHGGVLLHHEDDVAEGGDVGAAGGRGAEEQADLRDGAGELHLVAEDAARMAAAGEHVQLVGDAGPRRIDQVEERQPHPPGRLLHANHFLDGAGAPGTRLHRRIVGDDRHRPTVHAADAGDDAVGRQIARGGVGEQTILDEVLAPVITQQRDPLAAEQLAGGGVALVVLRRAAFADLIGQGVELIAS